MSGLPKTVFSTVDECISSLREELPLFRTALKLAKARHNIKAQREAKRMIDFLEDTEGMRARLQSMAKPDGSIHFGFTPEAWARFNEFRETGK